MFKAIAITMNPKRRKESKRAKVCVKLMSDGEWYSAQRITELTGYRHPNRAMTDVRQSGYEVQSRFVQTSDGKRVVEWKLASPVPTKPLKKRIALTKTEMETIFKRDNYTCALCKNKYDSDFLRVDHKEPISRSRRGNDFSKTDPDWMDRFQTLCLICNYEKREICKNCQRDSCVSCELYDPQKYQGILIKLDKDLLSRIISVAEQKSLSPQELIKQILMNDIRQMVND